MNHVIARTMRARVRTVSVVSRPKLKDVVLQSRGTNFEQTRPAESEPVRVVTIARQHGTGGELVAESVARALGLRLVDNEVFRRAAEEAGVSLEAIEASAHHPGWFDRMLKGLALGGGAVPSMWMPPLALRASPLFTSPVYRDFVEAAIRRLADTGDVLILGHGAQLVLGNRNDVFRVLIAGSVEFRAAHAIAQGLSRDEALHTIRRADEERVAYFKTFYEAGWLDPATYDLVINTDRLPVEAAAALITNAVRMKARPEPVGAE